MVGLCLADCVFIEVLFFLFLLTSIAHRFAPIWLLRPWGRLATAPGKTCVVPNGRVLVLLGTQGRDHLGRLP
jgi:hypothetical protein